MPPLDLVAELVAAAVAGAGAVGLWARRPRKRPAGPSAAPRCRECSYEIAANETLNGVPRRLRRCRSCDHRYWEEH